MPMFSGRTHDNIPVVGPIAVADIPLFMQTCKRDRWIRVAVGEHPSNILAAYNGGEIYLHPQLFGAN